MIKSTWPISACFRICQAGSIWPPATLAMRTGRVPRASPLAWFPFDGMIWTCCQNVNRGGDTRAHPNNGQFHNGVVRSGCRKSCTPASSRTCSISHTSLPTKRIWQPYAGRGRPFVSREFGNVYQRFKGFDFRQSGKAPLFITAPLPQLKPGYSP